MVIQYPHTADITISTGGGTDGNGYPLPPITQTVTLVCRGEPNTRSAIVHLADGTAYQYAYTVYVQQGQQDIPVGSTIKLHLTDRDIDGVVKMYSQGQLNQRIWL